MSLKQFNESFNKYFTECFNEDNEEEILETTEDFDDEIEDISYMNFVDVDDMTSNAKESLKESPNIIDDYFVGDEETGRIYHGKAAALKAFNHLKANGIDAVMNKVEDDSSNDLKETYDDTLSDSDLQEIITTHKNDGKGNGIIGGGLISPSGTNYLVDVAEALLNRRFNFLNHVQNQMNDVMHNIEVFDKLWSKEKQSIMKNIKEAQDLIPIEYRK